MAWLDFDMINLTVTVAGLMLVIIGLVFTIWSRHMERHTKRIFTAFFVLLIAYVLSNLCSQITADCIGYGWRIIQQLAIFFESLFSSILLLLLTGFLLISAGEDLRKSAVFRMVLFLWLFYFALLVFTQFTRSIYYIDEENIYRRGPWYPVLLVPPILIMTVDLAALLKRRKVLSHRQCMAFFAYILIPGIAMLIQTFFYGPFTIVFGSCLAALILFAYVFLDQLDHYTHEVEENARLREDIMLSQIQPHFLLNSLGAIRSLCRTDPEKAGSAIDRFTQYLRGNIDSLSQEKTVPFLTELEHTKCYLDLEKLRFEDALQVRYDLACTDFRIPTLSLQPLVENAVRYGVRGKESGCGTVTIASGETPDHYEVIISDDGPGFDPETIQADNRAHIGISNVRERIERMCGGSLQIRSSPDRGTAATIILPKEGLKK